MATKRKRGNVYQYTIRRSGVLPKPVYLSYENEAEGDEFVRRLEALLDRGIVPDELLEPTSADLLRGELRNYLSTQSVSDTDRNCLTVMRERLPADLALSGLTFVWATQLVTKMKRQENLSPSTIRHHIGALARLLDWIAAHGAIPVNPLRLLPKGYSIYTEDDARAVRAEDLEPKEDDERDRRLLDGEEDRIRAILDGEKPEGKQRTVAAKHRQALTALFDLALESGMRLAEIHTLTAPQIALERRTIFLDKTKNGYKRQVPVTTIAEKALRDYLPAEPKGYIFPWFDAGAKNFKKEKARVTSLLSRQFARIFEAAKCENLVFHDLRHEATSRFYERTELTDVQIAKILGWKSLKQAIRYANLRASKLAESLW